MPLWIDLILQFIFLQKTYSLLCGRPLTRRLYILLCSFSFLVLALSCHSLTKIFSCLLRSSVILMNWPFNLDNFWRNWDLTSTLSRGTFNFINFSSIVPFAFSLLDCLLLPLMLSLVSLIFLFVAVFIFVLGIDFILFGIVHLLICVVVNLYCVSW